VEFLAPTGIRSPDIHPAASRLQIENVCYEILRIPLPLNEALYLIDKKIKEEIFSLPKPVFLDQYDAFS
jgi:hypothetical protein